VQAQVQAKLQFKPTDKTYSGDGPSAAETGAVKVEPGSSNGGSHVENTVQPGASTFTLRQRSVLPYSSLLR